MPTDVKSRDILRTLAAQVAEIAALPQQREAIRLWKALNGLRPERPMVRIDQVAWHEMDVDGELTPQCEDPFCRGLEMRLRRTLYGWKHMRVDMVVEPVIEIPKAIRGAEIGPKTIQRTAATDPRSSVVGHHYIDQMQTMDHVAQKIKTPVVTHDAEATARAEARARELFDGVLEVRMTGAATMFRPWDQIVQWHGTEGVFTDLAARPEFIHAIMSRYTDAALAMLDQLEAQGLLGWPQAVIHCTGAHTDELPAPGFDPQRPRARDLWTCGQAQIFSAVSPAMHEEFELDYANRWYSRFGLVYYGCCEPLDGKLDIVRRIPHVRKISMSPWINVERGAERVGRDFVFSRKPSPAFLARDTWSPEAVERDLRETLAACRRHGCPVELILKDISTVRYQPQRLWEWADIAMRLVRE